MFIIQLLNLLKYRNLKYRSKLFSYFSIYTPIFLLMLNSKVSGQDLDPLQTDRPDQTECPFTVAPKHFQMEIGGVYVKDKEVKAILLDPMKETADIDTNNNSWPAVASASKFTIFKAKQGVRGASDGMNPMKAAKK